MKMKRFFALMLALALSLTMLQGVAFGADTFTATHGADGTPIGATMTFKVLDATNMTAQVGSGNTSAPDRAIDRSTAGALTIPATVTDPATGNTYTVTSIGRYAFYICDKLTAVTIPAGVTSIGSDAFWSCTSLASVIFAQGSQLDTIGGNAFFYCKDLTAITIPAGVTSIGSNAFDDCTSLASVIFAQGSQLVTIGWSAFDSTAITSISIPAGVTSIGNLAFNGCTSLGSVIFENGSKLETISVSAFSKCRNLATIDLPEGLEEIGTQAFQETGLTSITIPASVEEIGVDVFRNTSITTITFAGSNADDISTNTFTDASQLVNLNFAGAYEGATSDTMLDSLYEALRGIRSRDWTIQYNQNYSEWETAIIRAGFGGWRGDIKPYDPAPTTNPDPNPGNGSGSAGGSTAGAGAWYIGTLNGADGQPTYTQIVDIADTTAMLETGNVITVTGQSPTGVIVKLDPTALAGKQSLSINSSIANMQLTAEQIASLIQQAGDNTIHITIKQTADGSTINILAGGRTITL